MQLSRSSHRGGQSLSSLPRDVVLGHGLVVLMERGCHLRWVPSVCPLAALYFCRSLAGELTLGSCCSLGISPTQCHPRHPTDLHPEVEPPSPWEHSHLCARVWGCCLIHRALVRHIVQHGGNSERLHLPWLPCPNPAAATQHLCTEQSHIPQQSA